MNRFETARRRNPQGLSWLLLGWLVIAAAGPAGACPFCTASITLAERVEQSDVCCIVEWISGRPGDADRVDPGSTNVWVSHSLKDANGQPQAGMVFEIPAFSPGRPGDRSLLFGVRGDREQMVWDALLPCPDVLLDYMRQRPSDTEPKRVQLAYFLQFLEHAEETIAVDAYSEFARYSYDDVAAIADLLPRDKLRLWVAEAAPETGRIARRAFYGMLLGLCGDAADAELLREIILTPSNDLRLGIDGLMAGYLRLTGEPGLEVLQRHVQAPDAEPSEVFAFQQAVRFEWDFGQGQVTREQLRSALRPLVENPMFAELVLADLTRWEDLGIVDRPIALFGEAGFDHFDVQRAIADYYLTVSRLDSAGRSEAERAGIERAQRHLAALRHRDAELVEFASRRLAKEASTAAESTTREAARPGRGSGPPVAAIAGASGGSSGMDEAGLNPRWVFYPLLLTAVLLALKRTSRVSPAQPTNR